ncbi:MULTISPECIES: cysteine desulfurase family protein [Caproicibacterium]|uniref:cysteine desulfurase n=1 Tax=Caproicibacterium argilliputei TaxID=3030016 RepID=A0AA97D9Z5_9FIRM|nr:cysteine desulfurase family protein [Caproicibacterium argilliputei]WOC32039.1 cysteine desulfurase family protein [Caproicibacterium argilliputei]
MQQIYLDNSSTTRVCPEAADAVLKAMTETFGNPSSLHALGFAAQQALTTARAQVAAALSAKPEEITFTSGGTESNNLAVFGAAEARRKRGSRIVTTAMEHPSVLLPMQELEKQGFEVVYLKPDQTGNISTQQLFEAVNQDTILVSMMAVNNEVGSILPIDDARAAIDRAKAPALLHVDAVQAFGKLNLRPGRRGVDLMTVSSHKIHGPKGAGALFVRKGVHIAARTFGGGQERNLRPGTEAMPALCGFGAACAALPDTEAELQAIARLNRCLREKLAALPEVMVNSGDDALPYVLNLSAGRVKAQTMLNFLSTRGIYVSSGSACAKGARSHVLTALGLPHERIDTALRVSFCRYNTEEDCAAFAQVLQEGLRTLQKAD